MQKGDVYLVDLNPVVGSEQAGMRPVVIVQNAIFNKLTRTVVVVPFTTNLKRAKLPSAVLIPKDEGGLDRDSVALCHQVRVLDKSRLRDQLGTISAETLAKIDETLAFVLDM